jgi:hypothetical protein
MNLDNEMSQPNNADADRSKHVSLYIIIRRIKEEGERNQEA